MGNVIRTPSAPAGTAAWLICGLLTVVTAGAATAQSRPLGIGYEGFHGATTCSRVVGWAWSPDRPDAEVAVEVFHADSLLATVPADRPRADLAAAGKGDGAHGFVYVLPEAVRQAGTGRIEVRIAGTDIPLQRTPQEVPCPAYAAPASPPRDVSVKRIEARPVGDGAIRIDGRLDEEVWRNATFASDFLQRGPDRGYPRPDTTAVAFLYDEDALYIAARMQSAGDGRARTQLVRRDDAGNLERLLVSFDTYQDRRTAYTFGITTAGVRLDYFHPADDERSQDPSFDPVWEGRTRVDADGWTAELRIPFSQLRFPAEQTTSWGLNIRRFDPATFLNMYWVVVPVNEAGWASRFGQLTGIQGVETGTRLEVRPYALAGMTRALGESGVVEETSTRYGGEAKIGLGPNLTLDVTVNPDFGQIEADPAEVNLTQFETSFEERRPFFQEGAHLFEGNGPRYFYSRRVGGIPWGVREDELLNVQGQASIRSAAKVTGRLDSGLSIGALAALTSEARGELYPEGAPGSDLDAVAPRTAFAVTRLQKEMGDGSWAGLLLTGLRRDLSEDGYLGDVLARDALSGGLDWHLRLADGDYTLSGWAGFSYIDGDSTAILRIQRSGAHYFQRPDATHLVEDSAATFMAGYTGGLTFAKEAGAHFLFDFGGAVESPGLELRDAGAFDSADDLDAFANLRFRELRPHGPFRNINLGLFTSAGWNFEGIRRSATASLFGYFTWRNFWRTYVEVGRGLPALSDDLTRGGPLMGTPETLTVSAGLSNSFSAPTQWSLNGDWYSDEFGGWSLATHASVSVPLSSHLLLSVTPGYTRAEGMRQFLLSLADGPESTYGRRYIFGLLDRSEIYSQFRLDASPFPDFTLELYVEPFVSSGTHYRPGELAEAGGSELRVYGTDGTTVEPGDWGSTVVRDGDETFTIWNYDFLVRSFRSNAVLQWEWIRGSRLFLIWQQNRWAWTPDGRSPDPFSLWRATGDPGEHVLTVKLSYWLGL